jgi:hypothetical protein
VLEEIQTAHAQYPQLAFESFTQRSLQRVVEVIHEDGLFANFD